MRSSMQGAPGSGADDGPIAPSRRRILAGLGSVLTVTTAAAASPEPPSTVTNPPRDFRPGAPPTTYFTDPDVLAVEPDFEPYIVPNSAIRRLWTGALWSEGPAWNAVGRYPHLERHSEQPPDAVA